MTEFVVLVVKPSKNTQTQRCNNIKNVKVFQQKKLIFGEDTKNLKNASIDALGRCSVNTVQPGNINTQILNFAAITGSL